MVGRSEFGPGAEPFRLRRSRLQSTSCCYYQQHEISVSPSLLYHRPSPTGRSPHIATVNERNSKQYVSPGFMSTFNIKNFPGRVVKKYHQHASTRLSKVMMTNRGPNAFGSGRRSPAEQAEAAEAGSTAAGIEGANPNGSGLL